MTAYPSDIMSRLRAMLANRPGQPKSKAPALSPAPDRTGALAEARTEIARLTGVNTALRAKLDGVVKERDALRATLAELAADVEREMKAANNSESAGLTGYERLAAYHRRSLRA